ncbi:hypothetical protein [Klebsiella pneumoniae]
MDVVVSSMGNAKACVEVRW